MPSVNVELVVAAPAAQVWDAVLDITAYPSFMEDVRAVTIVHDVDGTRRSSWSVLLKGSVLEWTEDEVIDDETRTIDFTQVDGDLDHLSGAWQVVALADDETRVTLDVNFEIGIPLLADMLNPVAARALRANSERMLREIEGRAADGLTATRTPRA